MKVTLLFCLIAVYGAVADDSEEVTADVSGSTESTESTESDSVLDKLTPGSMLGALQSGVEHAMNYRGDVVNGGLEVAKEGVDLGINLTKEGLSGAKELLQKGTEMGEKMTNAALNGASNLTQKGLDLANKVTGNKLQSVFGAVNSAAQAGISIGDKTSKWGIGLGKTLGSNVLDKTSDVVGAVGQGISSAIDKVGSIDKKINAGITKGVQSGADIASGMGQKVGNFIASSWKIRSKSSA